MHVAPGCRGVLTTALMIGTLLAGVSASAAQVGPVPAPVGTTVEPGFRDAPSAARPRLAPLLYPANPEIVYNGKSFPRPRCYGTSACLPARRCSECALSSGSQAEALHRMRNFEVAPGRIVYEVTMVRDGIRLGAASTRKRDVG